MKMLDLLPKEEWAALEKDIHERFHLNARVYDDKGFSFTGYTTWCNRLCPAIKSKPEGVSAVCSVAHQAMAAEAERRKKSVIEECDAGLIKICTPVFVEEKLVGVVGGCGLLPDDGEVDTFMVEMSAKIPEGEVEALMSDLETISTDKAEAVAAFLEETVQKIVSDYKQNHP